MYDVCVCVVDDNIAVTDKYRSRFSRFSLSLSLSLFQCLSSSYSQTTTEMDIFFQDTSFSLAFLQNSPKTLGTTKAIFSNTNRVGGCACFCGLRRAVVRPF
jgi:hypothetical protein